jgi:hypothetical protein
LNKEFELFASFIVNDNKELIKNVFNLIKSDNQSVMFSFGGIGATPDDMTREVAGEVFSDGVLQIHQEGKQIVENRFKQDAYPNRINLVNFPKNEIIINSDPSGLSQAILNILKNRDIDKKVLKEVDSFRTLQKYTRVPTNFKNMVRRSKKTTFIYPNGSAFRVVYTCSKHFNFIKKVATIYSTSANIANKQFNKQFAIKNADILVYSDKEFYETNSSVLYKLNQITIKKVR